MAKFVAQRLISTIPVLMLISVISFSLMHFVPGDFIDALYPSDFTESMETREHLVRRYGLDQPLPVQYGRWLGQIAQGNLGYSIRYNNEGVLGLIISNLPPTLALAASSLAIGMGIGLPIGALAAIRRNSRFDLSITAFALIGSSVPSFAIGTILLLVFAIRLDWLPAINHLLLPSLTLGIGISGILARTIRAGLIEELNKDFVRTARAKGLDERRVIAVHVLRNALFSLVTILGILLGTLLGGAIVVEQLFVWQGIGWLVLQAITYRDYALVQGIVLFMALVFVLVTLLVDITYAVLDPRVTR
jgi:ABC-type dipeptide/oligopeptide/nickel transport system permease component